MNNGYIKLFRSFQDWYGYGNSKKVHLWIHLLLSASHKSNEFMFNGNKIDLKPGQFITGRKKLSTATGVSESHIERLLNEFENRGQIEQQKSNTSRLITILAWDEYQIEDSGRTTKGQQKDNKRTTKGHNQECKEWEECKNILLQDKENPQIEKNPFFQDHEFKDLWYAWLDIRKKIKAPNTEKALILSLNKLNEMGLETAKKSLATSIERGWRGVFVPKEGLSGSGMTKAQEFTMNSLRSLNERMDNEQKCI